LSHYDEKEIYMWGSEVALLRQQIENEYLAAVNGLTGMAIKSRHDFIAARYRRLDELHDELSVYVGHDTATKVISDISDKIVKVR
jgi:hypothetical protein